MAERRLAAVVMVDVVGFSRMMSADEEGTLAALKAHRVITDPVINNHGGRIVKGTGDGFLVEASSAVDAVKGALQVQKLMAERNPTLPEERRMQFRIGVNVGDIIVDDDGDVYGDGVNLAARVEALAPTGGLCVTDAVFRQVDGRIDAEFVDGGLVEIKNMPAVRVWRVAAPAVVTKTGSGATRELRPTIAVLPFDNMSGDADQDYFADGLVEDLITRLSAVDDLGVVARNSSFAHRGSGRDIRLIAREVDATYIVEGSVRKAGNRVRVNAQLIEAETGLHLWADRFDRDLTDIFAIQDEIVAVVGSKLTNKVLTHRVEQGSADPDHLTAWDLRMRAQYLHGQFTEASLREAIALMKRAVEIEPSAENHFWLSAMWQALAFSGFGKKGEPVWLNLRAAAAAAFGAEPNSLAAMNAMAWAKMFVDGDHDGAVALARRLVSEQPNAAESHNVLGNALLFAGDHEESIEESTTAWQLGFHDWWKIHIATNLAFAHYLSNGYESALSWADTALSISGTHIQAHAIRAAVLAQLDRGDEAAREVDWLLERRPSLSTGRMRVQWKRQEDVSHYLEGLQMAGIPE